MGRMKLGLNTMDDKMRKKLMIAGTNKSVDQFDSSNKYDSEDFKDLTDKIVKDMKDKSYLSIVMVIILIPTLF